MCLDANSTPMLVGGTKQQLEAEQGKAVDLLRLVHIIDVPATVRLQGLSPSTQGYQTLRLTSLCLQFQSDSDLVEIRMYVVLVSQAAAGN